MYIKQVCFQRDKTMKTYVTFGFVHTHSVNDKTFDKNCVAVIECKDGNQGRDLAFEYFGRKFAFEYFDTQFNHEHMKYYPRGYIEVN